MGNEAYKFLTDEERREQYDFGIWKDKPVRHHIKKREKIKDIYNDNAELVAPARPQDWGDKHLEEDEKVEMAWWGDQGCPEWLKEKRKDVARQRYGYEPVVRG